MQNILRFQKDIYKTNVEKGFWTEDRNQGEAVMLIVSELAEAVEAHRKDNWTRKQFEMFPGLKPFLEQVKDSAVTNDNKLLTFIDVFKHQIKSTVEDEIADAVIRILDCCYGWKWDLTFGAEFGKPGTGNFAHDILRINWYILKAFHAEQDATQGGKQSWYYVIRSIEALCRENNINLEQHIEWKLHYNKTRPHKHGKAY